ncbi:MAG: 4a-hydroxytetrahydrobiopterin dehydratase [Gammaproteobacteria bacterium]|nr:4a-hydroxytetrahydrobiopterin dehydratase [Gammaproteobacteria bacterium]
MSDLATKHCESCEGIGESLNREQIDALLPQLENTWQVSDDMISIHRAFSFDNFYETMAFMNAIAWIANRENHHPDVEIGYNYCRVKLMTHALNGLSHNDFICAAKIDQILHM